MNEVRQILGAVNTTVSSASSKGGVEVKLPVNGNTLPDQDEAVKAKDESQSINKPQQLEVELQHVNNYVQSIQRDLQFAVDKDLETTIIRVVDGNSGEVIRQIPEDIFLELARRLKQDGEMHLLDALG